MSDAYPEQKFAEGCNCACSDPDAHQVAALVASGMGQWQASQQVFGERGRLSASIRAAFLARWTDLRLPETGGAA